MSKTNLGLVDFAQKCQERGDGYVYGMIGQIGTIALFQNCKSRYPENNHAGGQMYTYAVNHWQGKHCEDCCGLIKYYLMTDSYTQVPKYNSRYDISANQMFRVAKEKGVISTIPEIKGLLLHAEGHVGVYIGNGWAIEARGTMYGVVKTKVSQRSWTHWFKSTFLEYVTNTTIVPTAQTNKPSPSPIKKPTIPVSTIVTPKTEDSIAITTDKLNIRDAMNMTSNIMMTLEKGHQVQIINYPNLVWAQVKPKGSNRIGYCVKQYLQVVHNVNVNFSLDTTSKDMKITDPAYNLLAKNVKPTDIKIDVVGNDKISVSKPYIDPKGRGTMIDIKGLCKGFAHVTVMYKNKTAQCNFNVK